MNVHVMMKWFYPTYIFILILACRIRIPLPTALTNLTKYKVSLNHYGDLSDTRICPFELEPMLIICSFIGILGMNTSTVLACICAYVTHADFQ